MVGVSGLLLCLASLYLRLFYKASCLLNFGFFFCSYFLLWSSAMRRIYVMVRFDSLWVYDPHDGEVNLWCVWICTVFRWYQVRERLGHFRELALPCWFCVLQTYIHSLWWSFRLFLLLWYKGTKALLSGSRGTIEPLSKLFLLFVVSFYFTSA